MRTCRGCGAAIEFVKSATGTTMCLNAEATPTGNIEVSPDGIARVVPKALLAQLSDRLKMTLRISHHAVCPSAAEFRRPR